MILVTQSILHNAIKLRSSDSGINFRRNESRFSDRFLPQAVGGFWRWDFSSVWATVHFYAHKMRVISLEPQEMLITSWAEHRFSRNPLYLGGNVLIFFGAA